MVEIIYQKEGVPVAYPASPAGLTAGGAAIASAAWQRLETYTAQRWTPRAVTWIVQGPGEWTPPLSPASNEVWQIWTDDSWIAYTPKPSPMGVELCSGRFQCVATIGANNAAPAAVLEAFKRLANLMGVSDQNPGMSSKSINLGNVMTSWKRDPAWLAKSLETSGAADLLRPYRRAE